MSKKILFLTLAFLVIFSFGSTAQLEDGSIAPNFSLTDINGNTHELYSLINEGKTVVLSIFWTIDGMSWQNHSQGILNDLWNQSGPNGTDEYFVIAIEGITSTTIDDLNGTGTSTQGDWVTGTLYPIVNLEEGNSFTTDYAVTFYPLYYVICPQDTTLRQISPLNVENATINNGCIENTTSIGNEQIRNTFLITTNLTSDFIQFSFPKEVKQDAQILLTNTAGITVFKGKMNQLKNNRLPVDHLPNGIYLATLFTENKVLSQRVSIQ